MPEPRAQVSSEGAFVSVPGFYFSAPEGLRHALKLELTTTVEEDRTGPEPDLVYDLDFQTDRALLDFAAVDPAIDLDRVERDCDILKDAIQKHPEVIRQAIEAVTGGGPSDRGKIEAAAAALKSIGLTEEHVHAQGGGFAGIAVVVVIALLCAGCFGCESCKPKTPADVHLNAGPPN